MEHGMEHKCVSYPHLLCPNCWFRGNRRKLSATGKHSKASAPLVCLHGHSFMQNYAFHQNSPISRANTARPLLHWYACMDTVSCRTTHFIKAVPRANTARPLLHWYACMDTVSCRTTHFIKAVQIPRANTASPLPHWCDCTVAFPLDMMLCMLHAS
jgi:hypothetical protein